MILQNMEKVKAVDTGDDPVDHSPMHRYTGPKKLKFKDVQATLRAEGISISRDTVGGGPTGSGEYRVAYSLTPGRWPGMTKAKAEVSSYVTDDLDDALRSGLRLASEKTLATSPWKS
jgi:hypothetical protein